MFPFRHFSSRPHYFKIPGTETCMANKIWIQNSRSTSPLSRSPAILAAALGWGRPASKAGRWWPQRRRKSHWSRSTLGSSWLWKVESTCWGTNRLWKWSDKAKRNWSFSPTTAQPWGNWKNPRVCVFHCKFVLSKYPGVWACNLGSVNWVSGRICITGAHLQDNLRVSVVFGSWFFSPS